MENKKHNEIHIFCTTQNICDFFYRCIHFSLILPRVFPHRMGLNIAMKQATGLATDAMVAARW